MKWHLMYISTAIEGVYCNEMKIIIIKAQIPIMGMLVHIGAWWYWRTL